MQKAAVVSSLVAIVSGLGFSYAHVEYWTQSPTCGGCSPELFRASIALGVIFLIANLSVAANSKPGEPWPANEHRERFYDLARISAIGLVLGVLASFVVIGLIFLPGVAVMISGAYLWQLASLAIRKS